VPLFKSSRPVFRAIGDALGLLESNSATTDYENGPVKPRLDVQASMEARADYREFLLLRTDVGAANTTVDIDVHVLGDWTEITHNGVVFVAVAGSEIPPLHDAWIISAGVSLTIGASLDSCEIFSETAATGAGSGRVSRLFGDSTTAQLANVTRSTDLAPAIMTPFPWWIPNVAEQASNLRFNLDTNAAVSTNLVLGVLSAPPGIFKRLY